MVPTYGYLVHHWIHSFVSGFVQPSPIDKYILSLYSTYTKRWGKSITDILLFKLVVKVVKPIPWKTLQKDSSGNCSTNLMLNMKERRVVVWKFCNISGIWEYFKNIHFYSSNIRCTMNLFWSDLARPTVAGVSRLTDARCGLYIQWFYKILPPLK